MQLAVAKKSDSLKSDSPEGKREELGQARDSFIESVGKITANMLGMVSKVGGQIYALLFLSRQPLSLDEISDILKLSKGNVSVNIRLLEETKLVRKVWVKGSRRDYYEAHRDYPRQFLKGFFDRVRGGIEDSIRLLHRCHNQFEKASGQLTGPDLEDGRFMVQQLALLASFYEAAGGMFDDFYQGRSVDTDLLRRVILE
ncbi:MAG: MarR family transcriptional regulator [Deltaproteobacteria bacterium]|nr:MarR family transcriptional regulator [Deltaproteobacteria bacterium]